MRVPNPHEGSNLVDTPDGNHQNQPVLKKGDRHLANGELV